MEVVESLANCCPKGELRAGCGIPQGKQGRASSEGDEGKSKAVGTEAGGLSAGVETARRGA